MREIIFDIETTGFNGKKGDRIIEIGAVELVDKKMTGKTYQTYVNPEGKLSDAGALAVHRITDESLVNERTFAQIVDEFMEFVGEDSFLIAHNAGFDVGFMNCELEKINKPLIPADRVIDSLVVARKKLPELGSHKLDNLCKYFKISLEEREKDGHGALLDSKLLADIYIELTVEKEQNFQFENEDEEINSFVEEVVILKTSQNISQFQEEFEEHKKFCEKNKISGF